MMNEVVVLSLVAVAAVCGFLFLLWWFGRFPLYRTWYTINTNNHDGIYYQLVLMGTYPVYDDEQCTTMRGDFISTHSGAEKRLDAIHKIVNRYPGASVTHRFVRFHPLVGQLE